MRVFVAGATGAVGTHLLPLLVERGHDVVAAGRSTEKLTRLRGRGIETIALDLLDAEAVRRAIIASRPAAVVHQATALAGISDFRHFDRSFAATNSLRTRGTDALLAGAREAGVSRVVAQSYAGWPYARQGGPVKTEDDPLDPHPAASMRETLSAIRYLERSVVDAGGIALRYGSLYGGRIDAQIDLVRKRRFPIIGKGTGVWSFIHLHDAATATVLAIEAAHPGVYNVTDDEPAPVRDWLPTLAQAVGAKPPLQVPRWLGRALGGEAVCVLMTESRGAANGKIKRELGWTPRFPSWRQGFVESYGSPPREVRQVA
ncbi:MAG TPA: NAD(P)-dependent oxidoreductase [Polyangia bacterium]|jgi:nucleoside-diphosphate-sugar epimerase|nr:NAD(P)-dependent oxidoreductase [Polyangia bacterium]